MRVVEHDPVPDPPHVRHPVPAEHRARGHGAVDQPGVEDLARDHPDRPGQPAGDDAGPRGTAPAGAAVSSRRPASSTPTPRSTSRTCGAMPSPQHLSRGKSARSSSSTRRPGRAAQGAERGGGTGRAGTHDHEVPGVAAVLARGHHRGQVPIAASTHASRATWRAAYRGMGFSRVALQVSCQRSGPGAERTRTSQAAPATSKTTVVTSPSGSRETRRETSRSGAFAGLGQLAAQRDLGGLHRHRVARTARAGGRGRARRAVGAGDGERGHRVEPAVVEPVRQHQQVAGEPVAADVRDLPGLLRVRLRERRATGRPALGAAGVVPAVGAHAEQRVVDGRSARPTRRCPATARSRSRSSRGSRGRAGLEPRRATGRRTPRRRRIPCWCRSRSGRRISSTRTPRGRRPPRQAGPRPSGSRLSRSASTPQGPAFSTSRNARTVDAVPASGSSRSTLAPRAAEARRGPSGGHRDDLEQPSRTRRRHSTSRLCGSRCAARSAGRSSAAGPDVVERGAQPGRARRGNGHRAAPRPARRASSSTHGWPGRRRSSVVSARSRTARTSCSPPARRGPRLVRKRRTSASAAAPASSRRTRSASASSRSARPVREPLGMVEVAGRQVLVGHLAHDVGDAALDQPAPGQLVDAERDVQGHRLLGAGGVRGAGGEVHRQARLEQHLLDAVRRVHLPLLGACGLEDEDVVGVGVDREALRAGRGQVGVGLAGVAELELELGDQPGQRRPVAVQALEDDRGAAVEERQRLAGVDQAGERPAGEGGAAGVRRLRQAPRRPAPRRIEGVRIAVDVSSWSASSRDSSPTRSRGSARCRWTRDAQTFARKVWASPLSRSRALRTRPRRWCRSRRRRSRPSRCRRSRCRRSRRVAVGGVGRVAVGAVGVGAVRVGAVRVTHRRSRTRSRWSSCRRR